MGLKPTHIVVTILITMLTALGPLSTDLYLPALPNIQNSFDTDVPTVQLTLSVYMVAFAVCQLFVGAMSDQFGRRKVLLGSTFIYFLASILCYFAGSIEELIAGRLLQAIGACGGIVIARAVIRDVYQPVDAAKLMSHMGTVMAIAPAAGPILGGVVTVYFGWQGNFVMLSAFGGLCLLGIYGLLEETNTNPDPHAIKPRRMMRNFRFMLSHRAFVGFMLACLFTYSGLFAWISGSAFVFIEVIGLRPDQYGYVFAGMVVGYMIGTQFGGRTVKTLGMRNLILFGACLEIFGGGVMLMMVLSEYVTVYSILLPMVFYAAGMGMVLPNSMASAVGAFPKMAGAASSLMGCMQYSGAAFVGLAVGHSFNMTAFPMAFAIAVMGGLTIASYAFVIRGSAELKDAGTPDEPASKIIEDAV
ncbi:multidrug effflux MFS transporter [Curvivirga aplysinae]|uniref:multidrug effflux MFS transporter n=1 Tax=Curvivirga aplysinae TaxID=2529852 RepID=UPI0012BD0B65|nr:multidrug effflux MFS transporter [Curvivirga aplysinae]MTI10898.1 Bcr/CflA family efflux MFS transporter [Curvivirga aplysinae]